MDGTEHKRLIHFINNSNVEIYSINIWFSKVEYIFIIHVSHYLTHSERKSTQHWAVGECAKNNIARRSMIAVLADQKLIGPGFVNVV